MNRFVIEGKLPSLNDYTKSNRSNKYMANKMKQDNQNYINRFIVIALSKKELKPVKKYPVQIICEWYEKNQRRDIDNISFAIKFILDSMVCMGIIEDDSQKYVNGIFHNFQVDKDNPRIEVYIHEDESV